MKIKDRVLKLHTAGFADDAVPFCFAYLTLSRYQV